MFRLAKPEDYEFIPDINLWELSFDKRPVRGVRCEDPVLGAQQYNDTQQSILLNRQRQKLRKQNFFSLENIYSIGVYQREHRKSVTLLSNFIMQKIRMNIIAL